MIEKQEKKKREDDKNNAETILNHPGSILISGYLEDFGYCA